MSQVLQLCKSKTYYFLKSNERYQMLNMFPAPSQHSSLSNTLEEDNSAVKYFFITNQDIKQYFGHFHGLVLMYNYSFSVGMLQISNEECFKKWTLTSIRPAFKGSCVCEQSRWLLAETWTKPHTTIVIASCPFHFTQPNPILNHQQWGSHDDGACTASNGIGAIGIFQR